MQWWRSGESTRLPPMWPGFYSQIRRHMWVEFVGSLLCTERFSPSTLVSPLLKNQHLTWFVLIVNFSLQCPQLVLLSARSTRHLSKIPFLSFLFIPKIKKWPTNIPAIFSGTLTLASEGRIAIIPDLWLIVIFIDQV